jgi:hypothetical protein
MTMPTRVHIYTRDAEGTEAKQSFWITQANFGAGVNLPTQAHIEALIALEFGLPSAALASTSIVYAYSVEVINELDFGSFLGGDGTVASAIAAKARTGIGVSGKVGPLGLEGEEFKVPGLNKGAMSFNPAAPAIINMTIDPWLSMRGALHDVGYAQKDGTAYTTAEMLESGVVFNGKRAPQRIR